MSDREIVMINEAPEGLTTDVQLVGKGTLVTLDGRLNESFDAVGVAKQVTNNVAVIDMSKVARVSSFGVRGWLQFLDLMGDKELFFYRCSDAVINQLTMMTSFVPEESILSVMVGYECESCGADFAAVYEAVADRKVFEEQEPELIPCPTCKSSCNMVDDPFTHLALEDHLVPEIPPIAAQVLKQLSGVVQAKPLEVDLLGDRARLRINRAPQQAILRRAFESLEGRAILDLLPVPNISADHIFRCLNNMNQDVTEMSIRGATLPLIKRLNANKVKRVIISSARLPATCAASGNKGTVVLSLVEDADTLARMMASGKHTLPKSYGGGWAEGPISIEGVADVQLQMDGGSDTQAENETENDSPFIRGLDEDVPEYAAPADDEPGHSETGASKKIVATSVGLVITGAVVLVSLLLCTGLALYFTLIYTG